MGECSLSESRFSTDAVNVAREAEWRGKRKQKALWLVGTGETLPRLGDMAQVYLRGFCIEHWDRFIKQRLNWCLPHLGTESQTQVWSTLMPLMTWQLWLGRHLGDEVLLPWQKSSLDRTPGRVLNGFSTLLLALGSPSTTIQLRGKSTGWPKGKKRQKRKRYPTVKKSHVRPKPRGKFQIFRDVVLMNQVQLSFAVGFNNSCLGTLLCLNSKFKSHCRVRQDYTFPKIVEVIKSDRSK